MEDKKAQLPWQALQHSEGDIPREALFEFAAALVRDDSLTDDLFELYERAYEIGYDHPHYEDLYVPAIFSIAAPQLSDERRRRTGAVLIEKLVEAGYDDADISLEVLSTASGSMGPVILPDVLEAIENEIDEYGAWYHLWGLTELAAETEDPELRKPVIKACKDFLEKAANNEIDPLDVANAAWTLARMKCTDSVNLMEQLRTNMEGALGYGDYADALDLMHDRLDYTPPPRMWQTPVMEWLEPRWQMVRDWHTKKDRQYNEYDEQAAYKHAQDLVERFLGSAEAQKLDAEVLEDAGFIANAVITSARDYVGSGPGEFNESVLSEVLLELLPRKVTADRKCFEKVAPVTTALLRWLESEGILADTAELAETVLNWSDKIVENGMNPAFWGMGKSFVMQAKAAGVDVTDDRAMQAFIDDYNRRLPQKNQPYNNTDIADLTPTLPIVEHSPKIGRNQPCPCGSGKKYKKCCGSAKNVNLHN